MKVNVLIDLIEFEEDNLKYLYSPALHLIGYGNTNEEAKESWETVLEEYLNFAVNKNTLLEDLKKNGWDIGKNHQLKPPTFTWMLQNNEQLTEIYDNHNFRKVTIPVDFQLEREYA